MSEARTAYAVWSDRENDFIPVTKGGVPKIYTLEHQAVTKMNDLSYWNELRRVWATRDTHYSKNFNPEPLQLRVVKVKIEIVND